jgi:hypothetical protein
MKKIWANLKLASYEEILSDKNVQHYLTLNHLDKENLYFDKLVFNDLVKLKNYLEKPNQEELNSLLRDASYPLCFMDQHKTLLFFYFSDKGLISFDVKKYSGIKSQKVGSHNYYLKTPSNNIEVLFSHILTSYISHERDNDSNFLIKAREEQDYLLTCFEFLCSKATPEESLIIEKESLYYWQSLNLFFQEEHKDTIINRLILPLVKHGLDIDYLKHPLFTEVEAFPFVKYINEIYHFVEKNNAEIEKNYIERVIEPSLLNIKSTKKNKL